MFLFLTLVIGVLVGLAVVAFILLTERFGARLYPAGGMGLRRLLVPVAGSLGMGYLLYRYFPDARGSGVPQTKAALYARDGYISLGTVIGKFSCTSATLAGGIPLGREGPAVQVGAGIASVLGRWLGLRPEKVKALLPVGATAAVAAAFNTPVAAVLFSLEEVVGDLHAPVLGSVVLASAISWAMLRLLLGNNPLFHVAQYQLVNPAEFGIYAVLGVAGGFYEELAHQDGIHLPTAETRQQDVQRRVSQAMREATEIMNAEMTVQEALERARSSEFRAWPVCDSRGVIGVVTSQRLRQAANEGSEASI